MPPKVVKVTCSELGIMRAWDILPPDTRGVILGKCSNNMMFIKIAKHKEWADLDKQVQINILKRSKVVITI